MQHVYMYMYDARMTYSYMTRVYDSMTYDYMYCRTSLLKSVLVLVDLVEDNADADQREDARHHIDRR